ncbi:hypothetical protein FRC07_006957 [Ceratobasidium sp. 392]|nr:hypothetical protein FRC07_006957 [Ceratobasidium sp. 392]
MWPASRGGTVSEILSALYDNPNGIPNRADPKEQAKKTAWHIMDEWATSIASNRVTSEVASLASTQTSELRLSVDQQNWEEVVEFSLADLQRTCKRKAPTLFGILLRCATSRPRTRTGSGAPNSQGTESSARNRDPLTIAIAATMMTVASRNMRANYLQKVLGLWLFSSSASVQVYEILCWLGITVSYNTVIRLLETLTKAPIITTKELALLQRFLIITDNINCYRMFFNPRPGQQNLMMSGAASTLVEILNYNPAAFDPKPVLEAQEKQLRSGLTADMLWARIDQRHLSSVMALHCVDILISRCPALSELQGFVAKELRSTYAIHRMPDGHKTRVHPLSTTSIDEGSAEGCRNNLYDILIHQLGLSPEVVNDGLTIIGGDLGMIKKLRALIALESSCKHGFSSFKWVLPLVQLWHMGWADLARLISTHWGEPNSKDPSTLWHNCALLGRKVKPIDRPDYYPAQRLVFDTLEANVIDCWRNILYGVTRLLLGIDDLDRRFRTLETPLTGERLLALATQLIARWASNRAYDIALSSDKFWDGPKATLSHTSSRRANDSSFKGNTWLANSIVRLRDSLIHREFTWGVADGDIGRVMQVMARRDEDFEGTFFQTAVSRNIQWFAYTRSAVRSSVNLKGTTSSHGALKYPATHDRLLRSLSDKRIRVFTPGQSFGYRSRENECTQKNYRSRDDLLQGRRSMPDKVKHFVRQTMHQAGAGAASTSLENTAEDDETTDNNYEPPAPAMVIDGQLIPGDAPAPDVAAEIHNKMAETTD